MFKRIITALGGNPTARDVKRYEEIAALIDAREAHFQMQSDAELRAQTGAFRQQLAAASAAAGSPAEQLAAEATVLDEILVDAFAVVREATVRTLGLRHYPAQLVGGQVLHAGRIAEMRTGEGKTLVATLPLYLNALSGRGVHLVTVNDYLARRDARWMGPVFHFLGLNVGILQDAARTDFAQKAFMYAPDHPSAQEDSDQMLVVPRRDAYHADIIYGTNNEFGFDYLRDNISNSLAERRQRAHFFAIVDEVDNVLIDSARTPLIISGPAQDDPRMYEELARVVRQLRPEHFEIDERNNSISLQDEGYDRIAELLGRPLRDPERPEEVTPEQAQLLSHAEQALRAEFLYKRNKDYLVQAGRVVIVDDFTGRVMPGRRWSDGLHQAVEAKEGVKVQAENVTYATITLQNYFRLYPKLAGMSGTAVTEAEEFNKIYKLDVVPIPTHLDYRARHDPDLMEVNFRENGGKFSYIARRSAPDKPLLHRRKDYDDLVFRTEEAKLRALTRDVLARHAAGQPMLIGTTSVEASEQLSHRLRAEELKKVALVLLLRARWFSVNKKEEDGRAIAELAVLMPALDDLKTADLRPLARELEMRLNPVDADNLKLLAELLQLNPDDIDRLATVLEGGIVHQVLNAKHHDSESQIIARAGALGAVTIATNMAGRGVDIKLGGEIPEQTLGNVNRVLKRAGKPDPSGLSNPERADALRELDAEQLGIYAGDAQAFLQHLEDEHKVRELGGLHVIASERHEARRIDNQLRGRAGRQGDPGSSRFYLSLGDELMRRFGGANVASIMERLQIDDAMPIEHGIVNKSIEQAQSRVEGSNFDVRKHLLEYDDVLNTQRSKFYDQRQRIFTKDDLTEDAEDMLEAEVQLRVQVAAVEPQGWWRLLDWLEVVQPALITPAGGLLFSFAIERLLDTLAEQVPALGEIWQSHAAAVESLQVARSALADPAAAQPAAPALATLQQHANNIMEYAPAVRERLLAMARSAAEQSEARYLELVSERVARWAEQLPARAKSRGELAELAYDGALEDARGSGRPLQVRVVAKAMFDNAGLGQLLPRAELQHVTPENLRVEVARQVEQLSGAEQLQTALRGLQVQYKLPAITAVPAWDTLDWEELQDALEESARTAQVASNAQLQRELAQLLALRITRAEHLTRAELGRIIVEVSFNREAVVQGARAQPGRVVQRFSYTGYVAAQLDEAHDKAGMQADLLEHLNCAFDARMHALGEAEIQRLSSAKVADLEPGTAAALSTALQAAGQHVDAGASFSELAPGARSAAQSVLGRRVATDTMRQLLLSVSSQLWVDFLTSIESLRTSIGLEAYAQRDPLMAYKSRAFDEFKQLQNDMRSTVVARMFTWQVRPVSAPAAAIAAAPAAGTAAKGAPAAAIGRNDPCRCGSGKKYKNCCMKSDGA